jgi:hypothetical protein
MARALPDYRSRPTRATGVGASFTTATLRSILTELPIRVQGGIGAGQDAFDNHAPLLSVASFVASIALCRRCQIRGHGGIR